MDKCAQAVLFFALNVLFMWLGQYLDAGLAKAIFDAHTSWAADAGQALLSGDIWSFLNFLIDIIGTVVTNYLIPAMNWWAAMSFSFSVASDISGVGELIEFGFLAYNLITMVLSLGSCIPSG